MHLQELKQKSPGELLAYAEELEIENASSLRKQEMMFAILKHLADNEVAIYGDGVLEVLQDGFGFSGPLRQITYQVPMISTYLQAKLGTWFKDGDTVEGQIRSPKMGNDILRYLKSIK